MKIQRKAFLLSLIMLMSFCPKIHADNDGSASENNKYVFDGNNVLHTKTDSGFTNGKPREKGDPHYGWKLGDFYVTGFTKVETDSDGTPIFLKNAGDTITLSFDLLENKNSLNGNEDIILHYDTKAYDEYFQTDVYQHSMGLLVIRETNYKNEIMEPIIFESFLEDAKKKTDKQVNLFEEGDYEFALDYELEVDGSVLGLGLIDKDSYEDYRLFFKFKVRNGNCMIFPRALNGDELTNGSYSSDGFFLDFAKTRYLDVDVKYIVLVEGKDGLVEDVRYNRPATDGEQYTRSGIYEITARNDYVSDPLVKRIYVGDDPSIKMIALDGMTLDQVNEQLYPEETVISETSIKIPVAPSETNSSTKTTEANNSKFLVLLLAIVSVFLVTAVFVVFILMKKNKSKKDVLDFAIGEVNNDNSENSLSDKEVDAGASTVDKMYQNINDTAKEDTKTERSSDQMGLEESIEKKEGEK